jgi:hypothetical protein
VLLLVVLLAGLRVKFLAKCWVALLIQKRLTGLFREASPEDLARIREAELKFDAKMKEMDVDIFELETKDKQDARSHFSGDWTARIIGILSLTGFLGYIFLVTLMPPDQNSDTIVSPCSWVSRRHS